MSAEREKAPVDEPPVQRHLRIIDGDTGEEIESCPECAEKEVEIGDLGATIRSLSSTIGKLRRDKAKEAKSSPYWPVAREAFKYWQVETDHKRSRFTVDRFFLLEPFLSKDGLDVVKLAIDGAAFDPYKADKPNRNGHLEVYDSIETIFKSRAAFERHVNRAPAERLRMVNEAGAFAQPYTERELRIKAEVILETTEGSDQRALEDRVFDAVALAKAELGARRLTAQLKAEDEKPEALRSDEDEE